MSASENRWMVDDSVVDVDQTESYYSETEDNPIISITNTLSDFDGMESSLEHEIE